MKKDCMGAAFSAQIDLHDEFLSNHACGIDNDLTLNRGTAANIYARMRGLAAITTVLIAESDSSIEHSVKLGNCLRSSLIEAVHALAIDTENDLCEAADRARKVKGVAA